MTNQQDLVTTRGDDDRDKARAPSAVLITLVLLTAVHFLLDFFAGTVNPLWPAFEQHLSLATGGALWMFVAWSVATSFSQFAFGWWADRRGARCLVWVGPVLVISCMSCLGFANSSWSLAVLLVIGGLGVAAFHPEAAALAGSLFPAQRSRILALFGLGGFLGQTIGPFYSGTMTDQLGLTGLVWGVVWGGGALLLLGAVWIRTKDQGVAAASLGSEADPLRTNEWGRMGMLLVIGSLRITPAMGVTLTLAYLLESQHLPRSLIGAIQSAYMAGIGLGGMICAIAVSHRWERQVLWILPLVGAPVLACLGSLDGWWLAGAVGLAGFLHGIGMPVFLSYGQRLLPAGERVASSITLGVCWGVASGLAAVLVGWFQGDSLSQTFVPLAAVGALSGLLCLALPRLEATS